MPDHTHRIRILVSILALAAVALTGASAVRAESPITWDLTQIYPSDDAWEQARTDLVANVQKLDQYKGQLGSGAKTLKEGLDAMYAVRMQAARLAAYAGMRGDEDMRESGPQGMQQALQSVLADAQAATAWIDPELLAIPPKKLSGFLKKKDLAIYQRHFEKLEERRPHVLDADLEELLGGSQRIFGVGNTVGGLLRNTEMPWETITLSDGTEIFVNAPGYSRGRSVDNRDDRIMTYEAFYGTLEAFKASLAATLNGTVQEHIFESRARKYGSSLESSLAGNEVDPAVYHMLIDEIHTSLPTLHRYLKLRAKILEIDDLRYHDMYPPLVQGVTTDYSWETSKKLILDSLAPLGQEYVSRFGEALEGGWVDVYPRPGKRSGAYVNDAAYEVHPYMLLNHQDDYLSTSTAAHEGGHLMHSWFSQEAQPYPTADYVIFVAEVASTVNEVIMFKNLVGDAPDDEARLALLGNFLEGLRTTVFRQTMFAEFELAIHEMAERGEPLTGDSMNEHYVEMLRRYHGEDEGVMKIDDLYAVEWAFIPHFHYDFYVYQYATSYIAATALAEGIIEDRPGAREKYLAFLKAGSTRKPVDLLKAAGVDMTSPEPIRAAMRLMNEVIDQIEEILARRD